MTVAAAALVLGIVLVTLAAVAWVWAWAEPDANGLARDHLTALADWALVALTLHALALVFGGTAGLGAYVVTFVLAGAAAVLRRPPGAQAAPTAPAAFRALGRALSLPPSRRSRPRDRASRCPSRRATRSGRSLSFVAGASSVRRARAQSSVRDGTSSVAQSRVRWTFTVFVLGRDLAVGHPFDDQIVNSAIDRLQGLLYGGLQRGRRLVRLRLGIAGRQPGDRLADDVLQLGLERRRGVLHLLLALRSQIGLRSLDLLQVRPDRIQSGGNVTLRRATGAKRGERLHLGLNVLAGAAHLAGCPLLSRRRGRGGRRTRRGLPLRGRAAANQCQCGASTRDHGSQWLHVRLFARRTSSSKRTLRDDASRAITQVG